MGVAAPVRVKVCGITSPGDARAAAECGADAIGLVFWAGSKRCVTPERAREIVAALPPLVSPVGVFVDAVPDEVLRCCAMAGCRTVQLAGDEPVAAARALRDEGLRVIRAVRVGAFAVGEALERARAVLAEGFALLLDARVEGEYGGTGRTFDWSLAAPLARHGCVVVAGGLTESNVAAAIRTARPFAVDVSSGVESAPGVKDREKVRRFIAAARGAC